MTVMTDDDARNVIEKATKEKWDVDFLASDRIRQWLLGEVKIVPLDPDKTKLVDYVRQRMAAAKAEQLAKAQQVELDKRNVERERQQQQQQQVEAAQHFQQQLQQEALATQATARRSTSGNIPGSGSTSAQSTQQNPTAQLMSEFVYDVDDASSDSQNEDDAYSFALDAQSFASEPVTSYGRSPSPLPAPLTAPQPALSHFAPHQMHLAPDVGASTSTLPYHSFFAQNPSSMTHPFQQAQSNGQPLQGHSVLNPALLHLSPQNMHIQQPEQHSHANGMTLQALRQSTNTTIDPQNALLRPQQTNIQVLVPIVKRELEPSVGVGLAKRVKLDPEAITNPNAALNLTRSLPPSVLKPGNLPRQMTESEQVWQRVEPEVRKQLLNANKAPISTVSKLFKLLSLYVTEPDDAVSTGVKEASTTDLSIPAAGRLMMLRVLRDTTKEPFDECYVTDPRATVLLAEWAKELALIAKGRGKTEDDEQSLKNTSRPLMEVLRKLPITLSSLRLLKGIGRNVSIISESDMFDEVTKDIAGQLVKKWKRLVGAPGTGQAAAAATIKKRDESPSVPAKTDNIARKRKLASPPPVLPPDKKLVVKKELAAAKPPAPVPKPATNPLTGTSSGKPLPSFARRKPLAAARPAAAAATPKAAGPAPQATPAAPIFDAFALSMADMQNEQKAKEGGSLPSAGPDGLAAMDGIKVVRAGRKRKSVRWQTDDQLEQIKFFESVIDFTDEFGNSLGDQDDYYEKMGGVDEHAEGAALHGLREELDWEDPPEIDFNLSQDAQDFLAAYPTADSLNGMECERDIQDRRQETLLAVTYFSDEDIPASANETVELATSEPKADADIPQMRLPASFTHDMSAQAALLAAHPDLLAAQPALTGLAALLPATLPINGSLALAQPVLPSHNAALAPPAADLSSLLASLNPSALTSLSTSVAAPAQQSFMPMQQPPVQQHFYNQSQFNGYNGITPSGPGFQQAQGYTSAWDSGPQMRNPQSIDWSSVGPVDKDAYKRVKRGGSNANGGGRQQQTNSNNRGRR